MVNHIKALGKVSADNGKGSVLESVGVTPESSSNDCIFCASSFHCKEFLWEGIISNGT